MYSKNLDPILLAKTEKNNFIESSSDAQLQSAIAEGRIRFVSVPLLQTGDGTVRRYTTSQIFGTLHPSQSYISSYTLLWEMIHGETSDALFGHRDIIGNRIFLKSYERNNEEDGCLRQPSKWQQLTKYSANCSLDEIDYDDFAGSVIMLGGTHSQNPDKFTTLSLFGVKSYSGIDMHANALMTMLYLNGSLERLGLGWSLLIVFVSFFLLDALLALLFLLLGMEHERLSFILLLLFSALLFFSLSIYFLTAHQLWFNWFVPLILFQIFEIILLIRKKSPKALLKIFKHIRT